MAKRRLKENAKRKQYRLRMDDEDKELLDYLSYSSGLPKSDIMRKALRLFYDTKVYK